MREPNLEKLNALVGKLVGDLGISLGGASILLGDRLGLYKAMADGAVITPSELAKKTGLHERYVREWLGAMATGAISSASSVAGRPPIFSPPRSSRDNDADANQVLASRSLTWTSFAAPMAYQVFELPFAADSARAGHHLEFRVWYEGKAYINVDWVARI